MCTLSIADTVYLVNFNITHTSDTAIFSLQGFTDEGATNEGCAFKNFFMYVDTCDKSCLTCNGPANVIIHLKLLYLFQNLFL